MIILYPFIAASTIGSDVVVPFFSATRIIVVVAQLVCLIASFVVFWPNDRKKINRTVSGLWLTLLVLASLSLHFAVHQISFFGYDGGFPYYGWRRANAATMALAAWGVWIIKEVIKNNSFRITASHIPWITVCFIMILMCFQDSFIRSESKTSEITRGNSYYIYVITGITVFTSLIFITYRESILLDGLRRVEMQLVALNLAGACFLAIATTGLGAFLDIQPLRRFMFFTFPMSAVLSSWALVSSRLYHPRQVFINLAHRTGVAGILALGVIALWRYHKSLTATPIDAILLIGIMSGLAFWLDRKSRYWLDLSGDKKLTDVRKTIIDLAPRETDPGKLHHLYEIFLAQDSKTSFAAIFTDRGDFFSSGILQLAKNRPAYLALCETGWATPESLERRRESPGMIDLRLLVEQQSIGMITVSPAKSRNPSLLLVLGQKRQAWPFTYPEVQHLQNIAELIDNILTRSRLTAQAALEARVEYLAMMSRGLAHDLKNLITPVSSFLIHTDNHFPSDSTEAEVHSAARRSVKIMTDYVREALFFSERLSPNFDPIDFSKLFQSVHEVVDARAARRGVEIAIDAEPNLKLTADVVLIQRVLGNLINNAIDASDKGQTVSVFVRKLAGESIRIQVKDDGCGIPSDSLQRIFDPYFTTKEFGNEVRGFGLGLTICQKIVQLHNGTISVESNPGRGTTLSVDLPQTPLAGVATKATT